MDDIERLKAALDRQVVFRCHPCPPTRLAIGQELAAAYPVHRAGPSSTAENTFPPELRHLLAQFGGLQLFCSNYEGNNGPWRSMAFELFSADEIIRISRNCRDEHPDNEWLGRLIIIGGDPSGDLFAIDSTVDSDACQVYHLDHGYLYGEEAAPDAQIEVAPSITSLLHRIVSGPLPWLGTWRHLDEYGEQYDVMSVEFLDGMPDHSDTTDIRVVDTGTSSGVADEPLVRLGGPDNNSWLYRGAAHCPGCTRIMDPASHDPGFRLVRRGADYSSTYDGGVIVSERFVAAAQSIPGATFTSLPTEPGFFAMTVGPVVRLDTQRNQTEVGPACEQCGEPRFAIRPGPHLAPEATAPLGFSRSDCGFGDTASFGASPVHLHHIVFVDASSAALLSAAGLRGLRLER